MPRVTPFRLLVKEAEGQHCDYLFSSAVSLSEGKVLSCIVDLIFWEVKALQE